MTQQAMKILRHILSPGRARGRITICGLMLMLTAVVASAAQQNAAQTGQLKTDSLPADLKAVMALMESTNRLNETAMELIRAHAAREGAESETESAIVIRTVTQESTPNDKSGLSATPTVIRDTVRLYTPQAIPGGRYVWIPDTMRDAVTQLLAEDVHHGIILHEDTIARGIKLPDFDLDPEVLHDRNLGRFHRGLFNYRFLPKGQWVFGLTANYGEFSTDDLEMFSVLEDVTLGGHSFSIKPQMQYLIRDNMAVGLRFNYTQTKGSIDNLGLDIDEDMSFSLHDISYKGESYAASLTFTQYLGLARRGRFGIFNEAELSFSSGNSDFTRPFDGKLKTTHTTTTGVGLNFSPGVSVFMMKQASFNISFGVFGFYLKNEKQWVDGVESGNRLRSGADFRFNIFNINFGIAIHI